MDFKSAFPELSTTQGPRGTASDNQRDRDVREALRSAIRQGWQNATVVNLHRFELDLNMGPLGHLTVPAKKTGTIYHKLVIDQPRIDMRDLGDAKYNVIMVYPKQLAEDICREYRETGGVFCYVGEGKVPEDELAEAKELQLKWYWTLFAEGNRLASEKHVQWISDRMRDAAKELVSLKLVAQAPDWVTVSRSESPDMPCEGCGQTIAKVAKFCPTCKQIFDPEWVKARRPDIWNAVFGVGLASVKGASIPDIESMIKAEQTGTAPVAGPRQ